MARTKKITEEIKTEWNLLHIFGYGESRVVKGDLTEKTVKTSSLTKAQALVDFMYSKKPSDNTASPEFHAITIAKDIFGRFVPKNREEKGFSVKFNELELTLVNDLISEIEAFVEPTNL